MKKLLLTGALLGLSVCGLQASLNFAKIEAELKNITNLVNTTAEEFAGVAQDVAAAAEEAAAAAEMGAQDVEAIAANVNAEL